MINELLKVGFLVFYMNGGFFNICESFDLKILVSLDIHIDKNEHKVLHMIS